MTNKEYPVNNDKIKQNIYDAVNGEWLKSARIPDDHSQTGGFMDLVDEIDKTLMKDSNDLKTGKQKPASPELNEYKKFYEMATDFQQREKIGTEPLFPLLDRINNLDSLSDLDDQLPDWILSGMPTPFDFDIDPDMKNAKVNALYAEAPGLFLPDKTYYKKLNPAYKKLISIFKQMNQKLFKEIGYPSKDANEIIDNAVKFDKLIAPHVKSAEEASDYSKMYNPKTVSDLAKATDKLNIKNVINQLIGTLPDKVILPEPEYFKHLSELLTDKNFRLLKDWMTVNVIDGNSGLLTDSMRVNGGIFARALSGKKQATKADKAAFYLASGAFSEAVGNYYGNKYFGEKAKADVTAMVKKMIVVYQNRLRNNDWLSNSTKQMALKKLSNLKIQVGYPDKVDSVYKKFRVTPKEKGGNLLTNLQEFSKISAQNEFSKWNKPVEREKWEMSANTVNAYYEPFKNIIVFPAAILQAPFYSLDQSESANYGGIGAVIAHEISHSFDNNGALFDDSGNLHNWWTKADYDHFKKLTKKMIKEFNGLPFADGKVNGKLTVSENIADAGGLSCAEEAAKTSANPDLKAFFINWARIWRMKATPQYKELLLKIDVHAPGPLRANVQVKNLNDFYSTFNVKPDDAMYLDPKNRVQIW